jgi:hypothetical protein
LGCYQSIENRKRFFSGRGAAWLARLLWEQEVGGSNPPVPTSSIDFLISPVRGFMRGFRQEQVFIQQFDVAFIYEERPDPFGNYRAGFDIRLTRRVRSIKTATKDFHGREHLVREYKFVYAEDPGNGVSLLSSLAVAQLYQVLNQNGAKLGDSKLGRKYINLM